MQNEIIRKLLLAEELYTSVRLIKLGLGEYQNLNIQNDFYYLPFQLLSSGFERFMKCYICYGYFKKTKNFPEPNLFRNTLGHDLLKIKKHIINNYFQDNSQALINDLIFLKENQNFNKMMKLLSEFGKFSRYYNLNVVTGDEKPGIDVKALWQHYECTLIPDDKSPDKNYETNSKIIIKIFERFTRALSRQFTLGDLGDLARQNSSVLYGFLMLSDLDLGTIDYRNPILE